MRLDIRIRESRGVSILELNGDLATREAYIAVRMHIREFLSQNKKILVDLGQVGWIDSGGLGTLVEGLVSASNRGGQLKLLNLHEKIKRPFLVTGLATLFEMYESEPEALDSFR